MAIERIFQDTFNPNKNRRLRVMPRAGMPNVRGMIGRAGGTPFGLRDTDKDGVINFLDCQPYNPKKQGLIHDIKTKYKDWRQEKKEDVAAGRITRKKALQTARQTREAEAIKTAQYKEELAGKRERERLAKPRASFMEAFGKGLGSVASVGEYMTRPAKATPTTRTVRHRVRVAVKPAARRKARKTRTKYRYVTKTVRAKPVQEKPRTMPNLADLKFNF